MHNSLLVGWFNIYFLKAFNGFVIMAFRRQRLSKKWYEIIASVAGDLVDAMTSYVKRIGYSEFFQEVAKRNPLKCKHCGSGMDLVRLYHPSRGVFYDLLASING